jgi:hypothetical protein
MLSLTRLWSPRVTCGVCGVAVPKPQTTVTRERGRSAVCYTCYERWRRSGRICVQCQTPVRGTEHAGVFEEQQALGHADCGGAILAG